MGRLTDLFSGRSVAALAERARRRLASGKLEDAARIVQRGLEIYPGSNLLCDLDLSIRRARGHKTMRHLEGHIEARKDPLAYEELIKLYLSLELPDEAERKAEEYVAAHPNRDMPHLLIGEMRLNAFFEDLRARHGHEAHEHLVLAANLNQMAVQSRLLLAELYFCIDARRSMGVILESVRQIAPDSPELEPAIALMEQIADPDAAEMIDGLFERIEVEGTLDRDPSDWPLSRRRGGPAPVLESEADPVAQSLVSKGPADEIVLLRRDGSVVTHVSRSGDDGDGDATEPGSDSEESGFIELVRTVTGKVFRQAAEFDMGKFKRFTIRGGFGNLVVGRIGNVMVGVRGAATTEPLRLWERVSADLERVANGKAARKDEAQAAAGGTSA